MLRSVAGIGVGSRGEEEIDYGLVACESGAVQRNVVVPGGLVEPWIMLEKFGDNYNVAVLTRVVQRGVVQGVGWRAIVSIGPGGWSTYQHGKVISTRGEDQDVVLVFGQEKHVKRVHAATCFQETKNKAAGKPQGDIKEYFGRYCEKWGCHGGGGGGGW